MKKILFLFLLLPLFSFAQPCADEDTVRSTTVTLITYNSARINGSISHFAAPYSTLQLKYVRVGFTDTVTTTGLSPLRNITGLAANTLYFYYYKTICASGTNSNTGIRTFTTLASTIAYVDERATQFPYLKADTGFMVPRQDTSIFRAPNYAGSIVFKPSDERFYGYNGTYWQPLAIDSAGIIALLDGKVDSVTTSAGIIYYWKQGVSYGFETPATFGVSGLDDAATTNRTFDNSTFTFTQNWTSPSEATETLFSNQSTNGSYGHYWQAMKTDGLSNPSYFLRVSSAHASGLSTVQDGITLDGGLISGVHKNIKIRTDSIILGGFSSPSTVNRTLVISGNNGENLSFPQLLSSANADDSMLVMDASSKLVGMRAITSGSTPTWQQTLTAGSTLTGSNTINGGNFDYIHNNNNTVQIITGSGSTTSRLFLDAGGNAAELISATGAGNSGLAVAPTVGISLTPHLGNLFIDTLTNVASRYVLHWDKTTGKVTYADTTASGGGTPSLTATQVPYGDGSNLMTSDAGLTRTALGQYKIEGASNGMLEVGNAGTDIGKFRWYSTIGGTGMGIYSVQYTTYRMRLDGDGSGAIFGNANAGAATINADATGRVGIGIAAPTSTLHTAGSFATNYTAQTGTYAILPTDYTVNCTSGTFTATLPTAVGCTGRIYFITNSGAGTITLATTSSQTFANVVATPTTLTIATLTGVTVQSNGANWLKISSF